MKEYILKNQVNKLTLNNIYNKLLFLIKEINIECINNLDIVKIYYQYQLLVREYINIILFRYKKLIYIIDIRIN